MSEDATYIMLTLITRTIHQGNLSHLLTSPPLLFSQKKTTKKHIKKENKEKKCDLGKMALLLIHIKRYARSKSTTKQKSKSNQFKCVRKFLKIWKEWTGLDEPWKPSILYVAATSSVCLSDQAVACEAMKEEAGEYRQYNGREEVVIVIAIVVVIVVEKSREEDRKERNKRRLEE